MSLTGAKSQQNSPITTLNRRKAELAKHALKNTTLFPPASWVYQCNRTWNVLSRNWFDFQEVMNNKALKELGCCEFSEHTSGPALTTSTFEANYLKSGTRQICQSFQLPAHPHDLRWCFQSQPRLVAAAPHLQLPLNLPHMWGSGFPERIHTFCAALTQLPPTPFPSYKKEKDWWTKTWSVAWLISCRTRIHLSQTTELPKSSFFQNQKNK